MSIVAASLLVKVGADTSEAESKLGGLSGKLNDFAGGMAKAGLAMSGAFTAPLVGAATSALKSTADFERTMNVMQQVLGVPADTMEKLQAQALELGASTSFSAGEAAEAMLELGKAGLTAEQIMGAVPGVMSLAAAGGVSLADAASLAAASMNTFGLEAEQTAYIADLMANAANASSADITDLMQGMRQGGFAFRLAGQDIDDLAASLAILTNNGLTGSDAGTALKNAFMRMMAPTDEAKELMNELGISFYDASGEMKDLPEIIGMLNKAFANLTNEERDAALSTLFLSDGMKAFAPLLAVGQEGFEEMLETMNRSGSAAETADSYMKGLAGAFEYLQGSIESAAIALAMPFLDGIGQGLRWVADLIDALVALPMPIRNAVLAFAGVLAAAGPVMLALGGIAGALAFLLGPIGMVTVAVGALAAAFAADFMGIRTTVGNLFNYIKLVVQDGDYLNDWLTHLPKVMQGPMKAFGMFIANLQDLGRYIGFVLEDGDYLNDWLTHLPSAWQEPAKAVGQFIANLQNLGRYISFAVQEGDYLNDWLTHLPASWQAAVRGAIAFGQGVQQAINMFFMPAVERVKSAWQTMASGFANLDFSGLQAAFQNLMAPVVQIAGAIGMVLGGAILVVSNLITNTLAAAMERLPAIAQTAIDGWTASVNTIASVLQGAVDVVTNILQGNWAGAWEAAKGAVDAAITGISTALTSFGLMASLVLGIIETAITNTFADFGVDITPQIEALKTTLQGVWDWVTSVLEPGFDRLKTSLLGAFDGLSELGPTFQRFVESLQPVGAALATIAGTLGVVLGGAVVVVASLITNTLAAAFDALPAVVETVISQLTASIETLTTVVSGVVTAVKQLLEGDFAGAWETLKGTAEEVATFVGGTFERLTSILSVLGAGIQTAFVNTLTDLGVDVTALVTEAETKIQAFKTWLDGLSGNEVFSGISNAFSTAVDTLTSWTWPDFPDLTTLTEWSWPDLPNLSDLSWPELPSLSGLSWPEITMPSWLPIKIDMPDWVESLLNWELPSAGEVGEKLNPLNWFGKKGAEVDVKAKATEVTPPATPVEAEFKATRVDTSGIKSDLALGTPSEPWKLDSTGFESAVGELMSFSFSWPDYPEWTWPTPYPDWTWPDIPKPSWVWVSIPAPKWLGDLQVRRPSWLDELWNVARTIERAASSASVPGNARGTPHWRGGWTLVGEEGPELVNLPRGAAIYPNRMTEAMLAGAGVGSREIHVTVQANVSQEIDIHQFARRIAREVAEEIRRRG